VYNCSELWQETKMLRLSTCHLAVVVISMLQMFHGLPTDVTSADTKAQPAENSAVTEDPRSAVVPASSSAGERPNLPDVRPLGGNKPQGQEFSLPNQGFAAPSDASRPDQQGAQPFGPPCRVVLLSNNSVLVNQQCPPGSNCTDAPPHVNANPNREIDVFFCTPPPGFRQRFPAGGRPHPVRCLVVDKETNDTRYNAECPPGTTCKVLDRINPDASVDIYLCTPPHQATDSAHQSAGDVSSRRRVPPPCQVVQKSSNTTVHSTDCPAETSCTDLDQRNTDDSIDVYHCAPSSKSSSRS
jgi:hypothetical protein